MKFFSLMLFVLLTFAHNSASGSGAQMGYALESMTGLPESQLFDLANTCAGNDECHLMEVALETYPLPEVSANTPSGRRLLAGLPDKHGWANSETHHCADEDGWCSCTGDVVYTKKCLGSFFGCNQANWNEVVSERWNSNHKSNVRGGVKCDSNNFGGDPFGGHEKQCFCHPELPVADWKHVGSKSCEGAWIDLGPANTFNEAEALMLDHNQCSQKGSMLFYSQWSYSWGARCVTPENIQHCHGNNPNWQGHILVGGTNNDIDYDYLAMWTEAKCHDTCGNPSRSSLWNDHFWKGFNCGFSCIGDCPIRAGAFAAGREHTFPIGRCAEHCYCVYKGWTG